MLGYGFEPCQWRRALCPDCCRVRVRAAVGGLLRDSDRPSAVPACALALQHEPASATLRNAQPRQDAMRTTPPRSRTSTPEAQAFRSARFARETHICTRCTVHTSTSRPGRKSPRTWPINAATSPGSQLAAPASKPRDRMARVHVTDDVWADFRQLAGAQPISAVLGELVEREVDRYRARRLKAGQRDDTELVDRPRACTRTARQPCDDHRPSRAPTGRSASRAVDSGCAQDCKAEGARRAAPRKAAQYAGRARSRTASPCVRCARPTASL